MVATGDLKSPVFGRAGSTPATRTKIFLKYFKKVLTTVSNDYIIDTYAAKHSSINVL